MGLELAGTPMKEIPVSTVFLGSCTNSRIEADLRAAAEHPARGRRKAENVRMMVVRLCEGPAAGRGGGPGRVFRTSARTGVSPGAPLCLGMNLDQRPRGGPPPPPTATSRDARARVGTTGLPVVAAATACGTPAHRRTWSPCVRRPRCLPGSSCR
ncbi:hypothetical protein QJS66_00750 [Kocuria rhizophila]|nr:hypothetical protein QJS66_00750 [Kocuria rhizophila]